MPGRLQHGHERFELSPRQVAKLSGVAFAERLAERVQ